MGAAPDQNQLAAMAAMAAMPGMVMPAQEPEAMRAAGTVDEWSPKGFGFGTMQDGRRVYIHNSQCGGEHLMAGDVFMATIMPDPKTPGKWSAMAVEHGRGGSTSLLNQNFGAGSGEMADEP